MKNTTILLTILIFCMQGLLAQADIDPGPNSSRKLYLSAKVAMQLGDLIFCDDDEEDTFQTNPGFGFAAEFIKKFSREFYLGAGAAMQLERDVDDEEFIKGSFKYFTAYGLLRADLLMNQHSRVLFGFVNLGYSTIDGDLFIEEADLKGDLYFGIGLGVQVGPVLLEAAYKNFGSYIDSEITEDWTVDADYRVLEISVGFIS